MCDFKKICIVGTGLIGASLALVLKRKKISKEITGVDKSHIITKALDAGIIDSGYTPSEIDQAVKKTDLIFLATPIKQIVENLKTLHKYVPKETIVTDVGSSKEYIVNFAQQEFNGNGYFIGGHPMAGSEKRGLKAADTYLFENCFYVLTPTPATPVKYLNRLVNVLEIIGAKVLILDAVTHDKIAAMISHLPQMLAVCLVNSIEKHNEQQPNYLKLAAGGFRDMTRIASSPFYMWQDICSTNSENIVKAMDEFIDEFKSFRDQFLSAKIKYDFEKAAKIRLSIPKDTKGFIKPLFDLSVIVEDTPGVIAEIAFALAINGINIRDIEVLKVRLLEGGTLRLSFETERKRDEALKILRKRGYICQKR